MDTKAAEAAIDSLAQSIRSLNKISEGNRVITPAQIANLQNASGSNLGKQKNINKHFGLDNKNNRTDYGAFNTLIRGNSDEINKLTLEQLMQVRRSLADSAASSPATASDAGYKAFLAELDKIIKSQVRVELDNARKFLTGRSGVSSYLSQVNPGRPGNAPIPIEKSLADFSRISPEVMPDISDRVRAIQSAINTGGGEEEAMKVNAMLDDLFNDVDKAILRYMSGVKSKIEANLLQNSMQSRDFLQSRLNAPGTRSAVIEAAQSQSQRRDLSEEQKIALKTNLDALIEAEGSTVDSRLTQAANAVERLFNKIEQVSTEIKQTAQTETTQTAQSGRSAVSAIKSKRNKGQRTGGGGGGGGVGPSPMSAGGGGRMGGGGGLGMAAKDMGDDADDAGRSVNSAFRKLNRVITDASAMLNSTATIAKGSLRVRDKDVDLETFARDLSKGMQSYVNTVNDAFNNLELPSGRRAPRDLLRDTVNESLRSGEVAGFTALSDEQRGLATAARGRDYGKAAGLEGPEAEKFALAYAKSVEDLVQQQTKLGEAVAIANLKTIEKNRADIDLLVQQGKYEEALKVARNTLITKTERDADGNVRVTREAIGNQTAEEIAAKGYTTDAANMAFGEVEDTERKVKRHKDINKEASGLTKLTRFAGQAMTVYGFLAMTIGTVAMKMAEFIEKANKLEKASATINALAGSTAKYNDVLSLATKQQTKFGGSLDENLQGFVSLVPATKKYGLDLEEVDNIARRLAIVDPLQGFSGAAIALKEFLSGDITSLSRRFEIDRKTLNSIKEAGTKAEQLKELDKVLSSMGISQAVLSARTATAAASFDKASSAWDNYQTLLGQGLQESFKPLADMVTSDFDFAGGELSANLMAQNQRQEILIDYAEIIDLSAEASAEMSTINKPASTLSDLLKLSADSMQVIVYGAKDAKSGLDQILSGSNAAIDALNNQRLAMDQTASFTRFNDAQQATAFARAGQYLGPDKIAASREAGYNYNPEATGAAGGGFFGPKLGTRIDEALFGANITSLYNDAFRRLALDSITNLLLVGNKLTGSEANVISQLAQKSQTTLATPDKEKIAGEALKGLGGIISPEELEGLNNAQKVEKILIKTLNDAKDGYITFAVAVERFSVLLGAELPKTDFGFMDGVNRLKKIQTDYEVIYKKIGDSDFATELYNKSLGSVNGTMQEISDAYTKQQALIYYNNTMMERASKTRETEADRQLVLESGLFDVAGDTVVERENAARAIAEASILQTRLLLDQEKSVTVLGAMGDNFGKYLVDLESATKLALEFNNAIGGLVTGPLMTGMSLQDQLNFSQMTLTGNVPGMQPQNTADIYANVGQMITLTAQIEQERLDNGNKSSNEIKDMNKQFFKDQNQAQEDHNKEMKELEEEHLKKMEEMRRESEVSKRSNEVGFYESLFGMDNLTAGQVEQAGAEYQAIKAEATALRNEGQFEKAAAVESAGKEGILSKYGDLEEKAKLMLDIKDADEETAELNKQMGQAKDADDRAEIQRKIDKIAIDKSKYENELAQITALETLKKNLYDAELLNARTLQESETENYKLEVGKRETDFADAEKEKTRKHAEEVAKRALAENEAHKVQVSNMNEILALTTFSNSFLDEARARTLTGQERRDELEGIYTTRDRARATIMNSKSLAAPALQEGLRQAEAAGPGIIQDALNSGLGSPRADSITVQKELSKNTFDLTTAMNNFTQAVLNGKVIIVRTGAQ
jgi:hypothetical protein